MRRHVLSVFAVLALVLVGCATTTPNANFYTLSVAGVPAVAKSAVSLAVGPVSVPADVDRPQIVVSSGPNRAFIDENNRWLSPLRNDIARVLAGDLAALLGSPKVTPAARTLSADADYRVAVDVQDFRSAPGESASLDAVWSLRRSRDGKTVLGRTTLSEPTVDKSYDALAAAHSRVLAGMAKEIGEAVRTLERVAP